LWHFWQTLAFLAIRRSIRVVYQHETLTGDAMSPPDAEVPYGTLDLMVLKTLAAMGPLHGYAVARRIEQVAEGALALNQGTIYPALLRLEQKGWIKSAWGLSENNRRARFYSITAPGRRQLAAETELWARTVSIVSRLLEDQ
jgi:PadR family transcriptional regulator PadR